MYVCTYVRTYVCMYVCIYVYMQVRRKASGIVERLYNRVTGRFSYDGDLLLRRHLVSQLIAIYTLWWIPQVQQPYSTPHIYI